MPRLRSPKFVARRVSIITSNLSWLLLISVTVKQVPLMATLHDDVWSVDSHHSFLVKRISSHTEHKCVWHSNRMSYSVCIRATVSLIPKHAPPCSNLDARNPILWEVDLDGWKVFLFRYLSNSGHALHDACKHILDTEDTPPKASCAEIGLPLTNGAWPHRLVHAEEDILG